MHFLNMFCIIFMVLFMEIKMYSICDHKPLPNDQIITGGTMDPGPKTLKSHRPPFSNIRIHLEYDISFANFKDSELLKTNVIKPAVRRMESMIKVKNPSNGRLRVPRRCGINKILKDNDGNLGCEKNCHKVTRCGKYVVPSKYLMPCHLVSPSGIGKDIDSGGDGLYNYDLIVFVGSEYCARQVTASASHCALEKELNRPISGLLNVCHGELNPKNDILDSMSTIVHELFHILAVSSGLYNHFRYSNGTPIALRNADGSLTDNWHKNIYISLERSRQNIYFSFVKRSFGLVLENILKVTREHFNCSSLDAVDLDNDLSHLSEYAFYNEIMTPLENNGITYTTKITLALLKDSGWYGVDYTHIEKFYYGENSGCIFVQGCYSYMEDQKKKRLSIKPFCNKVYTKGNVYKCSKDRKFYYFCGLIRKKGLERRYQYFKTLPGVPDNEAHLYGGVSVYDEYCPMMQLTMQPSSVCREESNENKFDNKNIFESSYGPNSLCFQNGKNKYDMQVYYGASCQKYHYDKLKKKLKIFFPRQTIECPNKKVLMVEGRQGFRGLFHCPVLLIFENLTVFTTDRFGSRLKDIRLVILIFYSFVITSYLYVM